MPFLESIGLKAIEEILHRLFELRPRRFVIKVPESGHTLTPGQPYKEGYLYPVQGELSRLTPGHEIWMLTQNITTHEAWPQSPATGYAPESHVWNGTVYPGPGPKKIRIVAVVAPPTSQMLFRYYKNLYSVGAQKAPPLPDIPLECRVTACVDVNVPKTEYDVMKHGTGR